jgi:hypothetical protein
MARLMAMAFLIFAFLSFNSAHATITKSDHVKQTHIKHTKSDHVKQTKSTLSRHKHSAHTKHTKNSNNLTINSNNLSKNENNLIYDADLGVTWYNPNVGSMTWTQATSWIESLNDPTLPLGGVMGWRLPFIVNGVGGNPISTLDIAFSEMEHLYLELGNLAGGPLTNTGPFTYLDPLDYWSSTDDTKAPTLRAFAFDFGDGKHGFGNKTDGASFAVLAVHSGNVGATQIPEPGVIFLFALGLVGIVVMRKKILQSF